jgi:hypothetical protein
VTFIDVILTVLPSPSRITFTVVAITLCRWKQCGKISKCDSSTESRHAHF